MSTIFHKLLSFYTPFVFINLCIYLFIQVLQYNIMCFSVSICSQKNLLKKFVFHLAYIIYITYSSSHLNPRMSFLHLPYFHTAHFSSSLLHPTHSSSSSPSFIPLLLSLSPHHFSFFYRRQGQIIVR